MVHNRLLNVLSLVRVVVVATTMVTLTAVLSPGIASAAPSATDWLNLRMCESHDQYSDDTGNGFYGAYQFSIGAWQSVGGQGRPDLATPAEQDYRAQLLYQARGWSPWPTCMRHLTGEPTTRTRHRRHR